MPKKAAFASATMAAVRTAMHLHRKYAIFDEVILHCMMQMQEMAALKAPTANVDRGVIVVPRSKLTKHLCSSAENSSVANGRGVGGESTPAPRFGPVWGVWLTFDAEQLVLLAADRDHTCLPEAMIRADPFFGDFEILYL